MVHLFRSVRAKDSSVSPQLSLFEEVVFGKDCISTSQSHEILNFKWCTCLQICLAKAHQTYVELRSLQRDLTPKTFYLSHNHAILSVVPADGSQLSRWFRCCVCKGAWSWERRFPPSSSSPLQFHQGILVVGNHKKSRKKVLKCSLTTPSAFSEINTGVVP